MTPQTAADDRRKLAMLSNIARALGKEIHIDRLLDVIVCEVNAAMDAQRSTLYLYNEKAGELWTKIAQGVDSGLIHVPLGAGISGSCAATRQIINIPDAYQDSRFDPSFDKRTGFTTRSILAMPIVARDGRLIGVIQLLNKQPAAAFTADDEDSLQAICTHLSLAIERTELVESYVQSQKFQQSLKLAHDIQIGLLPHVFPGCSGTPAVDVGAILRPALDVGGDLFDFFLLDERRFCFMIGDVSDKGVPAALFMAMVKTAFRMSAIASPDSITAAIQYVNRFLCENNDSQMFVTAFAATLDLRTGVLEYCDCGHEPPYLLRGGEAPRMLDKVSGVVLGFMNDYEFQPGTVRLSPGDTFFLYTDGVNEAMNPQRELYRTTRLEAALASVGGNASPARFIGAVEAGISDFVQDAPQSDDITMIAIKYAGPQ